MATLPVSVAVVNDYELIVAGVAQMLSSFPDQLLVRERIVMGDAIGADIEVALYDTYGRVGIAEPALRSLIARPEIKRVAVFTFDLSAAVIADARAAGAAGIVAKSLSGPDIADAIVRIADGEDVYATGTSSRPASDELAWPGKADGLTARESQVMVLAAEGLSNREIGAALYLSSETVKDHLHRVFTKVGLKNRAQAASYVHRSGALASYQPAEPGRIPSEDHRPARS
jgi:DNA-binding NarL/FixJ family response regulator